MNILDENILEIWSSGWSLTASPPQNRTCPFTEQPKARSATSTARASLRKRVCPKSQVQDLWLRAGKQNHDAINR